MKKLYVIYKKYCCDDGTMKSWNAIAELKDIFPTGSYDINYDTEIEFRYRKDAKRYCEESGYASITYEQLEKMWSETRALTDNYEEATKNIKAKLEDLKQGA